MKYTDLYWKYIPAEIETHTCIWQAHMKDLRSDKIYWATIHDLHKH